MPDYDLAQGSVLRTLLDAHPRLLGVGELDDKLPDVPAEAVPNEGSSPASGTSLHRRGRLDARGRGLVLSIGPRLKARSLGVALHRRARRSQAERERPRPRRIDT